MGRKSVPLTPSLKHVGLKRAQLVLLAIKNRKNAKKEKRVFHIVFASAYKVAMLDGSGHYLRNTGSCWGWSSWGQLGPNCPGDEAMFPKMFSLAELTEHCIACYWADTTILRPSTFIADT